MGASNGQIRKLTEGLVLYTNELYHKSYPGEPTNNLMPIAENNDDFSAHLGGTTHAFHRIYKDKDPNQQGMFKSLAPGSIAYNDVVYRYSWLGASYLMGMHTFSASDYSSLYLDIGSEYTLSCEVFVSETHYRADKALWPVMSIKATDQSKSYAYYDFSKKGTWQVVSMLVKPSLRSDVVATAGSSSSAGSAGSAGTSGDSGLVQTSLHHTVYFWPHEGTTSSTQKNYGYILYKNPQLEKNNKEYEGVTHRTQFSRAARGAVNSLKDISGNKNSLSVEKSKFDDSSLPIFAEGRFQNLGLTSSKVGYSSNFKINETTKKSYDFWINLTSVDEGVSTLMYSDLSRGSNFTGNDSISRKQHIYISQGRVHCNFYNEFGLSYSSFTQAACISNSSIAHIVVSVDMTLSNNKVKVFVDGVNKSTQSVSFSQTPRNLALKTYPMGTVPGSGSGGFYFTGATPYAAAGRSEGNDRFVVGNTLNYRVSSFNEDGESSTTETAKIVVIKSNYGVHLNWSNVTDAKGFYIYKSINALDKFSNISLLNTLPNSYFGESEDNVVTFKDDGSSVLSAGSPYEPQLNYSKYQIKNANFYDGSNLKLCIGDYPRRNKPEGKTHSEGKIYKVSVYKRALSSAEALSSYVQGYRDFDLTNNVADYNFSVSAGASGGGLGGGY